MDQARTKVSITLSPDVIKAVDRAVEQQVAGSRSAVIEKWLRRGSRLEAEDRLREATIAYYQSLSGPELAEDAGIARAAGKAARRLTFEE